MSDRFSVLQSKFFASIPCPLVNSINPPSPGPSPSEGDACDLHCQQVTTNRWYLRPLRTEWYSQI
ncbi:hypothetical protein CY34DRAFT_809507 [Suillus luteus UH-Slu-Lm8-n1]|uniref:Uncharacterized protein n=1 Tax=Suillus luteus UH-Slu-Lm8-n1 TaxID=930992 RepID=A0A0D0AV72_9AGAM|nr:hypothetical protein CY34DRAFT_809507 [Suillus luteus UH-Slu-Lm8-n1]